MTWLVKKTNSFPSLTVPDTQHTVLKGLHILAFQSAGNPALLTLLMWEPWDLLDLEEYGAASKLVKTWQTHLFIKATEFCEVTFSKLSRNYGKSLVLTVAWLLAVKT
jgi:hypothetical protein